MTRKHARRHGAGSIAVVSPGVYRAWKPPDADGKRQSARFTSREAAHRWLCGEPEPPVLLVGHYLERHLELRAPTLRGRSLQTARQFIGYAHPQLTSIPLDALTTDDCQAWLNELLATHTRYSVSVTRGYVSSAFNAAVPHLIPSNPLKGTRLPKPDERPARAWTAAEVGRLLAAAQGSHHAIWLAVALGTGLRLGELRALEWSDLDLPRLTVKVARSLDNNTDAVGPTKSGRIRVVDVPEELRSVLVEHRASQRPGTRRLFDHKGRPYRPQTYRSWLSRLCDRAGVPRLPPHSLRHTFCSIAIDAGVPIPDISQALGHASPQTTMQIYAHFVGPDLRRVARAVGEMLRPAVQLDGSTRVLGR